MNNPNYITVIFLGRSGSGKGTQAGLLQRFLETHKEGNTGKVFHLESGARFREFIEGESYSSKRSLDLYKKGILQPEFISVWVWADLLVSNMTNDEHVIFDGVPRRLAEAQVLESAFDFYERPKVYCIDVEVSKEESAKRLRLRGRMDDKTEEDIQKRLAWFETEVIPVLDFYKKGGRYEYIKINGEVSPEEVHEEVLKVLKLK